VYLVFTCPLSGPACSVGFTIGCLSPKKIYVLIFAQASVGVTSTMEGKICD